MALENLTSPDFGGILSSLPGVSTIVKLSQVALIVVIVYIAFLIIRSVLQIRYAFSMKKLISTVEEINNKLDKLVKKK